jgi:hypothetical protein
MPSFALISIHRVEIRKKEYNDLIQCAAVRHFSIKTGIIRNFSKVFGQLLSKFIGNLLVDFEPDERTVHCCGTHNITLQLPIMNCI